MFIPVAITPKALLEIKMMTQMKGLGAEMGLRIGVKGTGCAGTSYVLGFDLPGANDAVFDMEGVKIFIEKKHFMYLAGLKIDFLEDNTQRGFTFVSV